MSRPAKHHRDAPYLAAIRANPDDLGTRAVYSDVLSERGDVRGELIAIQLAHLAGRTTAASLRRELELLAAHGTTWMGSLARWFTTSAPVFEGGFFAGGDLAYDGVAELSALVADPAWPLVRTLGNLAGCDPAMFRAPDLRRIRRVTGFFEAEAVEFLAAVKVLPLEAFGFHPQVDGRIANHPLATCRALPGLRTLELDRLDARMAKVFARAPVIERLERLHLRMHDGALTDHIPGLVAAIGKRGGALRTIEIRCSKRGDDVGWAIALRRDAAPGPFTEVTARHASLRPLVGADAVRGCWRAINRVPRTAIRRLEIDLAVPSRLPASALPELVAAVSEMTNLVHVAVPWQLGARSGALEGTRYEGGFHGCDLVGKVARTWATFVDDLGQTFDTYSVNDRGSPALGNDPVATLVKRAADATTETLTLRRDGYPELVQLARTHGGLWQATKFAITTARSPESLISWFVGALSLGPFEHAHLHLGEQVFEWDAFRLGEYATPAAGWLVALGPRYARWLPVAAVTAAGLRIVPATGHLVIALAATPAKVTPRRLRVVADQLVAIMDAEVAARLKLDFPRHAMATLASVARGRGLHAKPTQITPTRVTWGRERLIVELSGVLDGELGVRLGDDGGDIERASFASKPGLRAALSTVAKVARERH